MSCRYGSCGQYERNVTTEPLVPDSAERPVVPGYVRTSKAERLLSLKPFQNMSDATCSWPLRYALARVWHRVLAPQVSLRGLYRCKPGGYKTELLHACPSPLVGWAHTRPCASVENRRARNAHIDQESLSRVVIVNTKLCGPALMGRLLGSNRYCHEWCAPCGSNPPVRYSNSVRLLAWSLTRLTSSHHGVNCTELIAYDCHMC